jgi:hypothetical protein
MQWIEVIRLRVPLDQEPEILQCLERIVLDLVQRPGPPPCVKAYQRTRPSGDITMVFGRSAPDAGTEDSRPAVSLLSELRCLGLVHHSVWVDLTEQWLGKGEAR